MAYNILPILVTLIFYFIFLFVGKPQKECGKDWLRKTRFDNSWWMLLSIVATNLTISGGIVASISGSKFYGPWFFLAPLTAAAGMILFSIVYDKLSKSSGADRLFLSNLNTTTAGRSFVLSFTIASVLIGSFLAGWEIHIASQAILSYYGDIPNLQDYAFTISIFIAILAGLYVSKGGWDRSVLTDIIQSITVFLFIVVVFFKYLTPAQIHFNLPSCPNLSLPVIVTFALALLINNVGYSLVNPCNWQIAQSAGTKSKKIFVFAAVILTVFSIFVYVISGFIENNNPFSLFLGKDVLTSILIPVIPLFVWSTLDTVSVSLSHLLEDYVSSKVSKNDPESTESISNILKIVPILFLVLAVLISHTLNTFKPNIFNSLLAATTSVIVFIPGIYSPLIFRGQQRVSVAYSWFVLILFVLVLFVSVTFVLKGLGQYLFVISLVGFLTSLLFLCFPKFVKR